MLVDRFASLLAAVLGFAGVMFVAKGVFRFSPDLIAKLSQPHLDFSLMQIQNLASQKADFISGAALVLIAFLIQTFALLFLREPFPIFEEHWHAAALAVAIGCLTADTREGVYQRVTSKIRSVQQLSDRSLPAHLHDFLMNWPTGGANEHGK